MIRKTWKTALIFGVPYALCMAIFQSLTSDNGFTSRIFVSTLIGGLVAGIVFALIMNFAANRLYKKVMIVIDPDEILIKEGGANHFKGAEAVGGKLILTNRRLIFKSHNLNIQNHEQSFRFSDIDRLERVKTLKLINNGLQLNLVNNQVQKFVVDEPTSWIKMIELQKQVS